MYMDCSYDYKGYISIMVSYHSSVGPCQKYYMIVRVMMYGLMCM